MSKDMTSRDSAAVQPAASPANAPDPVAFENLTPFQQGYVAAAFASLERTTANLVWNAEDQGRFAAFSDLAPETLTEMLKDCEARGRQDFVNINGSTDVRREGRWFWEARQRGAFKNFSPVTLIVGDGGKVYSL